MEVIYLVEYEGCLSCKYDSVKPDQLPCVNCRNSYLVPNERNDYYEPKTTKSDVDLVHHPAHYTYSKYEPKDVIRAWGLNFNLGSAVKYICRAGRKDDIIQELSKAKQFIEFEIEALQEELDNA